MKTVFSILAVATLLFSSTGYSMGVCEDPTRDADTCYKMRHLKSQINLMDAQRDLMQVNYGFMNALASDINDLVTDLLQNNNESGILTGLQGVQAAVIPVIEYSRMNDPRALISANQVRKQCLTCHSTFEPRSGFTWGEISRQSWTTITRKCNNELPATHEDYNYSNTPRNPYRCKSMHGMFSALEYFLTAKQANRLNFSMTEMASAEIVRISKDLIEKNMVHQYNPDLLVGVYSNAYQLYQLAQQQDASTDTKRVELSYSCASCHTSK